MGCLGHEVKECGCIGAGLHTQTLLEPRISVFPRQDVGSRGEGERGQLKILSSV